MRENTFLKWMAENTPTQYCNDSALPADYRNAVKFGAIGVTTNPPLSYQLLSEHPELFKDKIEDIKKRIPNPNDRVIEYLSLVVKYIAPEFEDMYKKSNGKLGYIRSQVEPKKSGDAKAMLEMGKRIATFGKNVMVKIPGTKAGIWVLEELAALGIPTTPTVCVSLPQVIATAEAYNRGCARAIKAGFKAPESTTALVMGRLQDFLAAENERLGSPVTTADLEIAALAVLKRANVVFKERKYAQRIMPAAFRCSAQVTGLVGGDFHMTIHPKVQDQIIADEAKGLIKREILIDKPVDEKIVQKVLKAIPDFKMAYEPDGMTIDQFDTFGATMMTLDGFDKTGWQKLLTL
ncbi:MAG: transaldolase family protein [Treponemataceae bacterium]